MTRHFFGIFFSLTAILLVAQNIFCADAANSALAKSDILEDNVAYLRIGEVNTNLPGEINAAQSSQPATNKTAGTVLDLRFAGGDNLDSAKAVADLFMREKLPIAVLVNGKTHGAAEKLAEELRSSRLALIFGSSTEVKPDVAVSVKTDEEKKFLENPFGTLAQNETNSPDSTNSLFSYVDHTTEADLVREKIKDGDQDENAPPPRSNDPQKPFIRDPVLARAVDLIKALAILRQTHA